MEDCSPVGKTQEKGIELILIDGAPGIACPVIASLTGCDLALLVTEPTLSGLHDLERIWKLGQHFQIESWVIVNKSDLSPENTEAIRQFCRGRDLPLVAEIPFDEDVLRSMMVGLSTYEYNPYGAFAQQVTAIWNAFSTLFNQVKP